MKRQQRGWLGVLAAAGLGLWLGAAGAARAADFYVDLDWTGTEAGTQTQPYRTISNAVAAANTADYSAPNPRRHTVRIAGGTYKDVANGGLEDYSEPANPNYPAAVTGGGYKLGDSFGGTYDRKRVVDIYGGYAGWDGDGTAASDFDWTEGSRVPRSTIIDLQGANSRAFYNNFGTHVSTGPLFDGLTIINGSITDSGAAIHCPDLYNMCILINNCLFSNNVATANGGAVTLGTMETLVGYVRNSEFANNQAAGNGGAAWATRFGQFSNTVFRGNQATVGGAVCIDQSPGANVIIGCTFENNQATGNGGAFYGRIPGSTRPYQIVRSTFRGNSAPSGAAVGGTPGLYGQGSSRTYLENCLVVGNTGAGYAVHLRGGNTTAGAANYILDMLHCTVAGNAGGGVRADDTYLNDNPMRVRNSIIANNGGYGVYRDDVNDPAAQLANNDVWNNTSGNYFNATPDANSISANPKFVSASDYHLAAGSPCRNAGATGLGLAKDLEGNARPFNAQDAGIDMGCYEHQPPPKGMVVMVR